MRPRCRSTRKLFRRFLPLPLFAIACRTCFYGGEQILAPQSDVNEADALCVGFRNLCDTLSSKKGAGPESQQMGASVRHSQRMCVHTELAIDRESLVTVSVICVVDEPQLHTSLHDITAFACCSQTHVATLLSWPPGAANTLLCPAFACTQQHSKTHQQFTCGTDQVQATTQTSALESARHAAGQRAQDCGVLTAAAGQCCHSRLPLCAGQIQQ